MEKTFTSSLSADVQSETLPEDFDDAFLKEIGIDKESREQTLVTLESMYGERVFHYEDHQGTVSVMANSCPAFYEMLEQGAPSAAAWLEANDQPQTEKLEEGEKEPENLEEGLPKQDQEPTLKQESKAVNENVKSEKPLQTKAKKEPVVDTKSETAQTSGTSVSVRKDKPVITQALDNNSKKSEQLLQTSQDKTVGSFMSKAKTLDIDLAPIETKGEESLKGTTLVADQEDNQEGKYLTKPQREEPIESATITNKNIIEPAINATIDAPIVHHEILQEIDDSPAINTIVESIRVDEENTDLTTDSFEIPLADHETYDEMETAFYSSEILVVSSEESEISILENDTDPIALDSIENVATVFRESNESLVAEDELASDTILDVMMNEIVEPKSAETGQTSGTEREEKESETLLAGIVEILAECIPKTPELTVELSDVFYVDIIRQTSSIVEVIEVLEKSKTAEECREALMFIRIELAELLKLLGYENSEALANNLVKTYGMQTLKKYITMVQKTGLSADRLVSQTTRPVTDTKMPLQFGTHAVRALVKLSLNPPKSLAA